MIKLTSSESLIIINHYKNLLAAEGIRTEIRNEYLGSIAGEMSFIETWPELWVVNKLDFDRAKQIIEDILSADERILKDPAPVILVVDLGASSVDLAVRPWVRKEDYSATRGDLLENIKTGLEDGGCSLPYPQQDVHLYRVGDLPGSR